MANLGKTELWYQCVYCGKWALADCSGFDSPTVLFGRKTAPTYYIHWENMWNEWMAPDNQGFPKTCYAGTTKDWMEADVFAKYFGIP